jgi:hypothetical protein
MSSNTAVNITHSFTKKATTNKWYIFNQNWRMLRAEIENKNRTPKFRTKKCHNKNRHLKAPAVFVEKQHVAVACRYSK